MSLSHVIEFLYPEAVARVDYVVFEDPSDGIGPRISYWNGSKLGPRPTPSRMEASRLPALKSARRRQIARSARGQMDRLFPGGPWELAAVRGRRPGDARIASADAFETDLVQKLAAIDDAKTEAELEAIEW